MDADNVALVDQLRAAAPLIPPSHLPSAAELLGVVGALIAYGEFGDRFLEAVKSDVEAVDSGDPATEVGALWTPPEDVAAGPATPLDTTTDDEVAEARELAALDQLAAAQGAAGRTTATVTPGDAPVDVPPPPGAGA